MSKRSDDLDRGLDEEIKFHLEQEIQKQMQAQQPRQQAQPTPATGGDFDRKVTRGAVTPK